MVFERVVGLFIKDDELYSDYRAAMKPLLASYGGGFRYDFQVSNVLKSETDQPINRVFTIYFKDRAAMKEFFADRHYKEIKEKFFDRSVTSTTIIAEYERPLE